MERGLKVASVPDALDYLMAGYGEDETLVALARSEDFPVDDAAQCRRQLSLEPMTVDDSSNAPALAFSKSHGERAMLVYAWSPDSKDGSSCYQYVSMPYELLGRKTPGSSGCSKICRWMWRGMATAEPP